MGCGASGGTAVQRLPADAPGGGGGRAAKRPRQPPAPAPAGDDRHRPSPPPKPKRSQSFAGVIVGAETRDTGASTGADDNPVAPAAAQRQKRLRRKRQATADGRGGRGGADGGDDAGAQAAGGSPGAAARRPASGGHRQSSARSSSMPNSLRNQRSDGNTPPLATSSTRSARVGSSVGPGLSSSDDRGSTRVASQASRPSHSQSAPLTDSTGGNPTVSLAALSVPAGDATDSGDSSPAVRSTATASDGRASSGHRQGTLIQVPGSYPASPASEEEPGLRGTVEVDDDLESCLSMQTNSSMQSLRTTGSLHSCGSHASSRTVPGSRRGGSRIDPPLASLINAPASSPSGDGAGRSPGRRRPPRRRRSMMGGVTPTKGGRLAISPSPPGRSPAEQRTPPTKLTAFALTRKMEDDDESRKFSCQSYASSASHSCLKGSANTRSRSTARDYAGDASDTGSESARKVSFAPTVVSRGAKECQREVIVFPYSIVPLLLEYCVFEDIPAFLCVHPSWRHNVLHTGYYKSRNDQPRFLLWHTVMTRFYRLRGLDKPTLWEPQHCYSLLLDELRRESTRGRRRYGARDMGRRGSSGGSYGGGSTAAAGLGSSDDELDAVPGTGAAGPLGGSGHLAPAARPWSCGPSSSGSSSAASSRPRLATRRTAAGVAPTPPPPSASAGAGGGAAPRRRNR